MDDINLERANKELASMTPEERIRWAEERFGAGLVLTTSGGETSPIIPHLTATAGIKRPIIFVDTGYYTTETYRSVNAMLEQGYDLRIYSASMSTAMQESLYGKRWRRENGSYDEFREQIKYEPLNRAFKELHAKAWIRGLMRWETAERAKLPFIQKKNDMYQIHPILDWTREEALAYLKKNNLPRNTNHFDLTKGKSFKEECLIGDRCGRE